VRGFEDRISRRKALKRVAAGAGVAWSAPILTSLRTPAFAQYGPCSPGCDPCQFGELCGTTCGCVGIPDECFCSDLGVCNPDGTPTCTTDADCDAVSGPGSRCASCTFFTGCVGSCWSPCGTAFPTTLTEGMVVTRPSR
jgi:hypothetical protein